MFDEFETHVLARGPWKALLYHCSSTAAAHVRSVSFVDQEFQKMTTTHPTHTELTVSLVCTNVQKMFN